MNDLTDDRRDALKRKTIGVLMGGLSAEREVSLRTGKACGDALSSLGYVVRSIDVQRDVAARLVAEGIELAFVALHGRYGEDGCIQGLLESMAIPYTGSGVLASAMGMDKVVSKHLFASHGLPIARDVVLRNPSDLVTFRGAADLPFALPAVIKPSSEGSSVGVTIARDEAELVAAVGKAAALKGDILIEQFIQGREIQAAVLDGEALGAIEIVPASGFYDYAAKYEVNTTRYLFPAPIPSDQYERACQLSLDAHQALGCSGATRSDMILAPDGQLYLLELNTLPGMTATSLLPKIAAGKGIDFPALCERLLLGASLKG
ncbi:MAG: D-alanine--D-alanine ligase [Myxococcales bacterium]|jgi:D-alanine-D-alanine ligase|nr:D-alanine--D-alanine ligase [Myxococcales bacterium]